MKTVEELLEQIRYHPNIELTSEEQQRVDEYMFTFMMEHENLCQQK